jgi:hypothetical protein
MYECKIRLPVVCVCRPPLLLLVCVGVSQCVAFCVIGIAITFIGIAAGVAPLFFGHVYRLRTPLTANDPD